VLRGNRRGGEALLRRAAESLQPVAGGTPYSVDVDGLRSWATRSADALQAAGPTGDGPAGLPLSPPPLRG
jgi:hypothetical protein